MAVHPSLTKSPLAVAKTALRVALKALTSWSCSKSRHDFTQPQLFAILAVKEFMRLDYRGIVCLLNEWSDLRKVLKIKKTPHYTTLQKAQQRILRSGNFSHLQTSLFRCATRQGLLHGPIEASIDSTGLESHYVSQHYLARRGRTNHYRRWHKLMVVCDNDSHLIPGAGVSLGPSTDSSFLPAVILPAVDIISIHRLLGDSGFDDEKNHHLCRDQLQIESVIAVNQRGSQRGVVTGKYRKQMEIDFPTTVYHQRVQVENVFSCMKRRLGSYLRARLEDTRKTECLMRVLTFNLMILLCACTKSIWDQQKSA